jgi:hypothetical protein
MIIVIKILINIDIKLNIFMGFLIGFFIIKYMNHKDEVTTDTLKDITNIKKNMITQSIKNVLKYQDITDFIFSIHDMYSYNHKTYNDMLYKLDYFFEIYEKSSIDESQAYICYETMIYLKKQILNMLKSLILTVPTDVNIRKKINIATTRLDYILTKYIDYIGFIYENYVHYKGVDTTTKFIYANILTPANDYDDYGQKYTDLY